MVRNENINAFLLAAKQVEEDMSRTLEARYEKMFTDLNVEHSKALQEHAERLSAEHEKAMEAKEQAHARELVSVVRDTKLKVGAQLADKQRKALDANSAKGEERMNQMRQDLLGEDTCHTGGAGS